VTEIGIARATLPSRARNVTTYGINRVSRTEARLLLDTTRYLAKESSEDISRSSCQKEEEARSDDGEWSGRRNEEGKEDGKSRFILGRRERVRKLAFHVREWLHATHAQRGISFRCVR